VIDRIAGRLVIASISGGKDSAAMSLHLRELGIEHRRVFMDTGWEHEATYDYLRGELTRVIGPIEEIRGSMTMEDLIRRKAMFPSRQRRFCTEELKVKPMKAYLERARYADCEEHCPGSHPPGSAEPVCCCGREREILNAIGIRAGESLARSKMPEWEHPPHFDCEVWRPIIMWSEQDVIDIHRRHGLKPNPLYLMGASRVGCWPCIMARKGEIRLIADKDPSRIDRLRVLEDELTEAARSRGHEGDAAKRCWFQPPTGRVGTAGIDEIVEWSRTSRGGRQFELFAPGDRDDGCMRWGMCDTPAGGEG
jgi:3'-phosphoadenosine 5'-phosphosulfate sulfotransferase (PAPS reductase)/FAD synthetase